MRCHPVILKEPEWRFRMDHPTRAQWKDFVDGPLEKAARHDMAVHLDDCQECLDLLLSLPAPVYRALGRPVCPWLPLDPPELEREVARTMKLCEERRVSGEPVTVSAGWACESLLLTVLSLVWVRLMRKGYIAHVAGVAFDSPIPPARPEADFAFLLGADYYRDPKDWRHVRAGSLAVLAVGPGDRADIVLPDRKGDLSERKLQPYAQTIAAALHSAERLRRQAVLCCALGADLPPGFFPGAVPAPFVYLQDPLTDTALAWSSVNGGNWLAREVLRRDAPPDLEVEVSLTGDYLRSLGPEGICVAGRLTARLLEPAGELRRR